MKNHEQFTKDLAALIKKALCEKCMDVQVATIGSTMFANARPGSDYFPGTVEIEVRVKS